MNYCPQRRRKYAPLTPDSVINTENHEPIVKKIQTFLESDYNCAEITPLTGTPNSIQSTWRHSIKRLGLQDQVICSVRDFKVYLVRKEVAK